MSKILNNIARLLWATFNTVAPRHVQYVPRPDANHALKILVITIEYDKFADRTIKVVNNRRYPCGRPGIDNIVKFCMERSVDYLNVITTDESYGVDTYSGDVNRTVMLSNGGTDIAALYSLRLLLKKYTHVIVANSSHNSDDSQDIDSLFNEVVFNAKTLHFVIGFNGNSRMSPKLPIFGAKCEHVITNIFACPTEDLLHTLEYGKSHRFYAALGGFSNKFFAIRYFEILLSRNSLINGGELILLKDGRRTSSADVHARWPARDSRFYGQ